MQLELLFGLFAQSNNDHTKDPTLFSGTFRSNVDPFDKFSTERIQSVLQQCKIAHRVELDERILEGSDGSGLSVGERQVSNA